MKELIRRFRLRASASIDKCAQPARLGGEGDYAQSQHTWRRGRKLTLLTLAVSLTGCAQSTLTESGALSSYNKLKASDGMFTRTRSGAIKELLLSARTVRIIPTAIAEGAVPKTVLPAQMRLVSNAIDRNLCAALSRKFHVVLPNEAADLTIHAVITHVGPTDVTVAKLSSAINVGGTIASSVTGVPIPSMRIPMGLGSLSVEGEAVNSTGKQLAALVWARGADTLTTKARASSSGDAYGLANEFSADFSKLLMTGEDPLANPLPMMPTPQGIGEFFGAAPKYAACAQFGPHPGLPEVAGQMVGLPPEWTDRGPK